MDLELLRKKQPAETDLEQLANFILETQKKNGEIPWFAGGRTDPWDHVEAAMGLAVCGYYRQAGLAYQWLADRQLSDGSWYASYMGDTPADMTRDTNVTAYIAVGVYHYYLITGDVAFLKQMWNTIRRAIDFAVNLQAKTGEIYWAKSPKLEVDPMALLTGSSSIFMSIKCAIGIAETLGISREDWKTAAIKLQKAIGSGYRLFNIAKSHYSMDWFYPVLCGAVTGDYARKRLDQYWKKFVVEDTGVLCVSTRQWVTVAETCELVLTLAAAGNYGVAEIVFSWIHERRFEDGTYWCGFTYPEMVAWPDEKITWTNGVVLMAADALYDLSPAGRIFSHDFWEQIDILE